MPDAIDQLIASWGQPAAKDPVDALIDSWKINPRYGVGVDGKPFLKPSEVGATPPTLTAADYLKPGLDFVNKGLVGPGDDLTPAEMGTSGPLIRAAVGASQGVKKFASSMTAPANLALLAGGGALAKSFPLVSKALAGGFGALMTKQAAETAGDLAGTPKNQRTAQNVAEDVATIALTGGTAGLTAYESALAKHPSVAKASEKTSPQDIVPQPETPPATPAASPVQPETPNATIPVGKPETLPVGQTPGDSGEVGARVPGPEAPSQAQGAPETPQAAPDVPAEVAPAAGDAAKADTAPAVAKIKAGVERAPVKPTADKPSQQQVKTELVSRLEKAVADAKPVAPDVRASVAKEMDNIRKAQRFEQSTRARAAIGEIYEKAGVEKVTFDIPGDGTFTVWNTPEALQTVLDRASKLATDSGKPRSVRYTGTSKEDRAAIKETLDNPQKEQEGSLPGTQSQPEQQQLAGNPERNPTPPTEMAPSSHVGPSRRAIEGMKSSARISEVVPPQEGVDPSQISRHGQELIDAGADHEQVMQQVEKTKRANDDDIAVIRRHQENLAKVSDATAEAYLKDRFAKNAPELEAKAIAAREAEKAWTQRIQKSAAPIFARLGHSFQGVTDINTDSWIGLQRAYGKEFTPKQLAEAQAHAKANKAAQERIAALEKQLADLTDKMPGEKAPKGSDAAGIKKVFADYQPGKPMTDLQAKTLWNYLRSRYAEKFGLQLHKVAAQIATDLGLTHDDVLKGLGKPAGVKKLADAILVAARERRRLKADAKNWVENQKTPGWTRFVNSIPQGTFNLAIFGHGGTWIGTHTPAHVFNPGDWATLFPAWFRSLKTFYKTAIANDRGLYHEQNMQRMTSDQLYPMFRVAGLKIDPGDRSQGFQNKAMDSFLGRWGLAGNEAFDGLKLFRFAKAKGEWNALPESLKTKEMASALADAINTSTGASNVQMPKALSTIAFAPRLEYSRWKLLFGDTARTANTFRKWSDATPEEKQAAMRDFRQKATIVGTYMGLLALNQHILKATGSKQDINFTDSKRGDWLEFKVGGLNVGVGTPFLHIFGLLRNLAQDSFGQPKGKLAALDSREKNIGGNLIAYGRQKLSPIGQRVADVATQRDIMGNVVPWSNDQLKKYEVKEGKHKLGVGEYAAESFTPIFMAQGAREIWKDQGMTKDQSDRVWRAIVTGAAGGLTGARVGQQTPYFDSTPK